MDNLIQELRWPKFQWRYKGSLSILSALLAFIPVGFPGLMVGISAGYRVLVGILIFLSTFLLVTAILWFFEAVRTIVKRVSCCPKLMETYNVEQRELTVKNETLMEENIELNKTLSDTLLNQIKDRSFEIKNAAIIKERFYISLAHKLGYKVAEGDMVYVIDKKDSMFMGLFKVTELHDEFYYAEGIKSIDPLWLGYVRQWGETKMLPNMVAICIYEGG